MSILVAHTSRGVQPIPLAERIKTRIEHDVDARLVGVGAWLLRLTKGRIVRFWHVQALILTTRGRRSGLERTVILQFFPDGDDMIVVAANSGLPSPPAWYFNLTANPRARVEVGDRTLKVRAEELSPDEAAAFWPRVLQVAPDYARYPKRTSRRIAMIRLVPETRTGSVATWRPAANVARGVGRQVAEVAPGVYCLGPRGRTQTNVYFVRAGSSWVLIDTGWRKDGPSIKEAAESVFGTDARPASILLTHGHPDHAGSALQLARLWDRPVFVHPDELPFTTGDFSAITASAGPLDRWVVLPLMRAMGRRRREAMLSRSSLADVVRALEPSAEVPGLPGWQCIPTPGHTPGHVSFLRTSDRVLITGDAVVNVKLNSWSGLLLKRQGLSGPPWYTTWSWRAAKKSVATLAWLEPNVLATGHGTPMTGAGTAGGLRAFSDRFCTGPPRRMADPGTAVA